MVTNLLKTSSWQNTSLTVTPNFVNYKKVGIKYNLKQFVFFALIASAIYLIGDIGLNFKAKSATKLERIWQQDLKNLADANKLPKAWNDIRIVEKEAPRGDPLAIHWKNTVSAPIQINPNGHYKLEILILSLSTNGHRKAVIQHHLIHIDSGNSVWELGRTYSLD